MGIPLIAGTDCGLRGIGSDILWREISLLAEFGLSAMEALRSATSGAARVLGVDHEVGSLEAQRRADLIAVSGLVTTDLGALARPSLVLQGGRSILDQGA